MSTPEMALAAYRQGYDDATARLQIEVAKLRENLTLTLERESDLAFELERMRSLRDKLRAENERLTEALKIYARRYHPNGDCWNWRNYVCDSFSGECAHFDWEGAEQEEAWEIAEKALSPPSEAA